MSDTDWDEDEAPPPSCPILAGPGSITWSRPLPAELEGISEILGPMEDPVNWFGMDPDELRRLSWIALTSFNIDEDSRLAEIVGPIYMEYRDSTPVNERAAFIDEISHAVASGAATVGALMMLCLLEEAPALIATAAFSFATASAEAEGQTIQAAAELLEVAECTGDECRAGVFLGLAAAGDPEILDLLRPGRAELTDDEVSMICAVTIVDPFDTTILFFLDWLEEAQAEGDTGRFRILASAITPAGSEDDTPPVADGRHLFIDHSPEDIPDDCYFPIERRHFNKYIAPRLRAIAGRETDPRVLPGVLEAYGLEPEGEVS